MRPSLIAFTAALLASSAAFAQQVGSINSVGMQFVLINPGAMTVGWFRPPPQPRPVPVQRAAGPRTGGGAMSPTLMNAADANRDGRLSRAEWMALAEGIYTGMDTEKSDRIFRPEFGGRFNDFFKVPGYNSPGYGDPQNVGARAVSGPLFRSADADRNGFVTRSEFNALFARWFSARETQDAGGITEDQLKAGLDSVALQQPPQQAPTSPEAYARFEQDAKAAVLPGFRVEIPAPYYIGRYEVTQGQWKKVMGSNPSVFPLDKTAADADNYPVDSVTWAQAREFVRRLNALEHTKAYRLPTEFEWEYAARAGAEDDIAWPSIREQARQGLGRFQSPAPVGQLKPNAWGLYDTLGNVWEWVEDFYNEKIFADPAPPRSGSLRSTGSVIWRARFPSASTCGGETGNPQVPWQRASGSGVVAMTARTVLAPGMSAMVAGDGATVYSFRENVYILRVGAVGALRAAAAHGDPASTGRATWASSVRRVGTVVIG